MVSLASAACGAPATVPVAAPPAPPIAGSPSSPAAPCADGMVPVPAGTFTMGDRRAGPGVAPGLPIEHSVTLSTYCIDRFEVTVASYTACVASGTCTATPVDHHPNATRYHECNGADPYARLDHPINCVTWDQAAAYCAFARKRLPTEAEWEYAARGSDGRHFPWGDAAPTDDLLEFRQRAMSMNTSFATSEVGMHPHGASPVGADDMAGNVAEWVADWMGHYPTTAVTDPRGPSSGDSHVYRGGSWTDFDVVGVDAVHRIGAATDFQSGYVGFRCAASRIR
nr:SUMF1/EgtB/PvdO family nonheme iron enzyme [Kofleriaceae bacterium]